MKIVDGFLKIKKIKKTLFRFILNKYICKKNYLYPP